MMRSGPIMIRLMMVFSILMLCSCGGGNSLAGTGGVGSGGTGIVSGTVTGLASIVIDGQDIQESILPVHSDGIQGPDQTEALSQLQIGAQMQISLSQGQPQSLSVRIQLAGPIQSVNSTGLIVQGVPVRVNTNPIFAPVTFFAGVSGFAGLQTGQQVAISGIYAEDHSGPYVLATRIAVHASASYQVITGVIDVVQAGQLTLNQANWPVTAGVSLASVATGSRVTVWIDATGHVVKVLPLGFQGQADSVQLTGVAYNISGQTFWLQGTEVVAINGLPATVSDGALVSVQGSLVGGVVQAQGIQPYSPALNPVLLQGNISQYVGPASMEVRGVPIDASTASIQGTLGDGVFVNVQGIIQGNHVQASKVTVTTPPVQSILTQQCTVSQVESTRLICQSGQGVNPVQLTWIQQPLVHSSQGVSSLSAVSVGQTILYDGQLSANGAIQADSLQILSDQVEQAVPANPALSGQMHSIQGIVYGLQLSAGLFSLNNLNFALAPGVAVPTDLANGVVVEVAFVPGAVNQVLSITVDH